MTLMTLRDQLIRDEGIRLTGYKCPAGYWTIGVGHNVEAGPLIPIEAVNLILDRDIRFYRDQLLDRLPWIKDLDYPRVCALVNLAFNMGIDGLIKKNPKMLAAMKAGKFDRAAAELLDGPYKDQVGERANRLATQIRTGEIV